MTDERDPAAEAAAWAAAWAARAARQAIQCHCFLDEMDIATSCSPKPDLFNRVQKLFEMYQERPTQAIDASLAPSPDVQQAARQAAGRLLAHWDTSIFVVPRVFKEQATAIIAAAFAPLAERAEKAEAKILAMELDAVAWAEQIDDLKAKLAAAEQQSYLHKKARDIVLGAAGDLQDDAKRLREALAIYGTHEVGCVCLRTKPGACTCGLAQALAGQPEPAPEKPAE